MKLYACFTPSHRPLLERHFLPSLPPEWQRVSSGYPGPPSIPPGLVLRELFQRSPTGAFASAGFQATCLDKVDFIIEALKTETEPFLFSDVDVRFYGPVVDDLLACLGDADMAFQWDGPRGRECTGFMVLRPTEPMIGFWERVRKHMLAPPYPMDQDAFHSAMLIGHGLNKVILPERYWSCGRNDKRWEPYMKPNPPADLLVHHANWTVGIENKLALLEAVRVWDARSSALADPEPTPAPVPAEAVESVAVEEAGEEMVPASKVQALLDQQRAELTSRHTTTPLAIVLQFFSGDKRQALSLARLIADVEPARRDDVGFVFARQSNCPMDAEIYDAMLYVGTKFHVTDIETKVDESKQYPGVVFDAWASAVQQLSDAYLAGRSPYASAFFVEPDGCPLRRNWIDRLKAAHAETLQHGKRITGARMLEDYHINGSLVMHLSLWEDRPSLHRCPPREAWDIFHGPVLVAESHPTNIIANMWGQHVDEPLFWHLGRESAWVTSIKDGSAQACARRCLVDLGGCWKTWKAEASLPPNPRREELIGRLIGTERDEAIVLLDALHRTDQIVGTVCEFGVAQGATSALIANEILADGSHLHLFDSFQGLPAPGKQDKLLHDVLRLGSMEAYEGSMVCPWSMVEQRLEEICFPEERTHIHAGWLADTLTSRELYWQRFGGVRFAYLDVDLWLPTMEALSWLRMVTSPGAIVVVDDYDYFTTGPKLAVDEAVAAGGWSLDVRDGFCVMTRKS